MQLLGLRVLSFQTVYHKFSISDFLLTHTEHARRANMTFRWPARHSSHSLHQQACRYEMASLDNFSCKELGMVTGYIGSSNRTHWLVLHEAAALRAQLYATLSFAKPSCSDSCAHAQRFDSISCHLISALLCPLTTQYTMARPSILVLIVAAIQIFAFATQAKWTMDMESCQFDFFPDDDFIEKNPKWFDFPGRILPSVRSAAKVVRDVSIWLSHDGRASVTPRSTAYVDFFSLSDVTQHDVTCDALSGTFACACACHACRILENLNIRYVRSDYSTHISHSGYARRSHLEHCRDRCDLLLQRQSLDDPERALRRPHLPRRNARVRGT